MTPAAAPAEVALPNLRLALRETALAAALVTVYFLAPASQTALHRAAIVAAVVLFFGIVVTSTYRYEIRGTQLVATEMHRIRRTVDLTRLASVTAPGRREPFWPGRCSAGCAGWSCGTSRATCCG